MNFFNIDKRILEASEKAMALCADKLREIENIQEYNQIKMIKAFQNAGVRESYFCASTGYGYDDFGRDALDRVYAYVFDAEDALVRHNFVSGTHALTVALFGILRPNDTMLSVMGMPYDTIRSAIGIEGNYPGSLKDFDIHFEMTELCADGTVDYEQVEKDIAARQPKMVYIQRSRGYSLRATLGVNREMFMGAYHAPHVTGEALKTAVFASALFELLGFDTNPRYCDSRGDIIQLIMLGDEKKLISFCGGIQSGSAVDSFVQPMPSDMPGYESRVIMAAGAFTLGSSIELSADAPLREPYAVWMQGSLNFHAGKLGVMLAANRVLKDLKK